MCAPKMAQINIFFPEIWVHGGGYLRDALGTERASEAAAEAVAQAVGGSLDDRGGGGPGWVPPRGHPLPLQTKVTVTIVGKNDHWDHRENLVRPF